jgi:regulator of RNase E activity RraA
MTTHENILSALEPLYAAVVCDVLDSLGYPKQALPHNLRPLTPAIQLIGRAFTARATAVHEVPAEPYKLEIEAVDRMTTGDILVAECGGDTTCGFWGELLTTACLYKGIRGVVMDACTRDVWKIKELDFPVFGLGYHPADSKGRMDIVELECPVHFGDVKIHHGDYLIGDEDGLVAIPAAVLTEALTLAAEKVSGENVVRKDLAAGVPMGEVFQRYGIL